MEQISNIYNSNALQRSQTALQNIPKTLANFPTFASFSQRFNPSNWDKGAQMPTKCVTCNAPTVTDINLAYGEGRAIAWLMAQLTAFQERLNVPNKMNVYEIDTCAQTIFENFHHLKTTELMIFFSRLLGGMYPVEWHGYVTPSKIVSALRDHFMPWRNDLLYKIEKQQAQQSRHAALHNPDNMSYEEWQEIKMLTAMYNPPAPSFEETRT